MKMDVFILAPFWLLLRAKKGLGKWLAIIDEPNPSAPALYCVTTTMTHYAKALAHAALGNVSAAEEEKQRFIDAFATVPETRTVYNNTCGEILVLSAAKDLAEMLNGEIEYRKGNYEVAFKHGRVGQK